ncbi:MAG: ROK family protein [Chitinophagaceae bacterium]
MSSYAIGIDIGGTKIAVGIVDQKGKITCRTILSTKDFPEPQNLAKKIQEVLAPEIENHGGKDNFKGIGIGAPNANFYTGCIEYAPNLAWKGKIHLTKMFQEVFDIRTIITNDANAAALGEMIYGGAKNETDFIVITLGTGVGSGIIINGKLVYGHDGFAGELGHCIVVPHGRKHWSTGFEGSLESYCSATGLRLTALEFLKKYPNIETPLRYIPEEELTSAKVGEAAAKGDNIATQIFDYTGDILGRALANFVMFSNPHKIILFGGVVKAGDLMLRPTKKAMEENLLPIFKDKVDLIISPLHEADAAILGASSLAWA